MQTNVKLYLVSKGAKWHASLIQEEQICFLRRQLSKNILPSILLNFQEKRNSQKANSYLTNNLFQKGLRYKRQTVKQSWLHCKIMETSSHVLCTNSFLILCVPLRAEHFGQGRQLIQDLMTVLNFSRYHLDLTNNEEVILGESKKSVAKNQKRDYNAGKNYQI